MRMLFTFVNLCIAFFFKLGCLSIMCKTAACSENLFNGNKVNNLLRAKSQSQIQLVDILILTHMQMHTHTLPQRHTHAQIHAHGQTVLRSFCLHTSFTYLVCNHFAAILMCVSLCSVQILELESC